jgi:hypothetical protein
VRGPLFLIKETLLDETCEQNSVVENVLKIREQLKELMTLAHSNECKAKKTQKT